VRNFLPALLIAAHATAVSPGTLPRMIAWNVGQGAWTTWSAPGVCVHFDMGGERFNPRRLRAECSGKKNFAVFSHWDWDHISFAAKSRAALGTLCVLAMPGGSPSASKRLYLSKIPPCRSEFPLVEIEFQIRGRAKTANGASRVFLHRGVLFPGDPGTAQEKFWIHGLAGRFVRGLMLGHHGSKTSTSALLLSKLGPLKFAIASARSRVYGHPHRIVRERLKERGISLIPTEDWGNLIFNAP